MEFENIVNVAAGLIFLILVGLVFCLYYLRNLQQQAQLEWKKVRRMVSVRLDLIPLLCENLQIEVPQVVSPVLHELIQLRGESWEIRECSGEKVNKELLISQKLHDIWSSLGKFTQVQLVALQKEIAEIGRNIEKEEENYNLKVRKYNRLFRIVPLRFLFQFFHFQRLTVFEFEA